MKKIDTDALEKMAKQKNIDKDKIEKIADEYKGKSQNELMDELVKIGKTLEGKEEVISKFKTFLDDGQRKKLDLIMNKISDAEIQEKVDSKKKSSKSNENTQSHTPTKSKQHKGTKNKPTQPSSKPSIDDSSNKKKIVKKVKRIKKGDGSI